MTEEQAKVVARKLRKCLIGVTADADKETGTWGVRTWANADELHTEIDDMPPRWQRELT